MAVNPYALDLSGLQQGIQVGQQLRGLKDVRGQRLAARQEQERQQAFMGLLQQTDLTDPQQAQALATQFPGQLEQIREQQSFAMEQLQITDEYKQQASEKEKRDVNHAANNMLFIGKTRDTDAMVQSVRNNAELIIKTTGNPMMVNVLENLAVDDPDQFVNLMQDIVIQTGGERPTAKQLGTGPMAGWVFDPNTGNTTIDPNIKQELADIAKVASEREKELDFSQRTTLQNNVDKIVSTPIELVSSARDLQELRRLSIEKNYVAQVAILYKFIKTLDPTGVVRDAETGMIRSSGGPVGQLIAYHNRILGGGPLTDEMIDNIVELGSTLANNNILSAEQALNDFLDGYKDTVDEETKQMMRNRLPVRIEMATDEDLPPPPPDVEFIEDGQGNKMYLINNQWVPADQFAQPVQEPTSGVRPIVQPGYTIADA